MPGKMNVIAIDLSWAGHILPTEWSLHKDMANHVFNLWGHPNVTWYNHKCPMFVLPAPDARALDTDALTIALEGMFAYAFPPQIRPQVLRKFSQIENCTLLLIAPFWPKQIWFPGLLTLSGRTSIPLPPWERLFKQPKLNVYHQSP